ncbi:hypothetical protein EV586_101396 [Tumebacillus sp. BK434]|uniref:DUF2642 domain-containing protein n=1 Tax=Tumebacillus sp. BK434 TaxID=2512169 RepID=UPI00104AB802|nr:DUF2642 domain-containing protein [Tumebacillus sp. BK434]TCP59180.1 hypothetical protein EV586_101396 [Tumebacillus sp. BK434]
MNRFRAYLGSQVQVEISGGKRLSGTLAEVGGDLLVLLIGDRYTYIPFVHVQKLKACLTCGEAYASTELARPVHVEAASLSYRNLLMHVRGQFVEIYVSGKENVHGYLTSVMNNYFVFYSPVYKTIYISLEHLKWLIPYPPNLTPYSLAQSLLPVNPNPLPLARSFDEQCKKLVGQLVVFDFGDKEDKIGLLKQVEHSRIELINAGGESCHLNLQHLKAVHLP